MTFTDVLGKIDNFVWGVPLIVLIMGTGIFLTCRLGVLQFRKLGKALKYMVKNEADGIGEVISCYVLGMILYKVLNNYRSVIFKNED